MDQNRNYNQGKEEDDDQFGLPDVDYTRVDHDNDYQATQDDESSENKENEYWGQEYSRHERNTVDEDNGGSNTGIIIGIIALLIIIGGGVWFFFLGGKGTIGNIFSGDGGGGQESSFTIGDTTSTGEDTTSSSQQASLNSADTAKSKSGFADEKNKKSGEGALKLYNPSIEQLNSRTGRSYIIIGSFVDADLAMDYAQKLKTEKEIGIKIIKPFGNAPLHRVAIAEYDSFSKAMEEVDKYRKEFGQDAWALKY